MSAGAPPAEGLVFRGRREVIVADGAAFRELETGDRTRAFFHGGYASAPPEAGLSASRGRERVGRFVLLLHDPEARTLEIHTDRIGAIPLFRRQVGEGLLVSLRLKDLADLGAGARLDPRALGDLLAFQRVLGTRTPLEGVSTIDAGAIARIDLDTLAVREERPWRPEHLLGGVRLPFEEARDELTDRFLAAVDESAKGKEDLALTLSGGLDTRCMLAAAMRLGRSATTWHVSLAGSRAARYAQRSAEICGLPFHGFEVGEDIARAYPELLDRVVRATDGMKFAPQVEMLWLRDRLPDDVVVLHGAFGELAKIRELRDLYVDPALGDVGREGLAEALWPRYEAGHRRRLAIFAPEVRRLLDGGALQELRERILALPEGFGAADLLQLLYLQEMVRSTRYGHLLWNQRLPTRFPFLHPEFVDLLLRVRNEDRMGPRFQTWFLERVHPELARLPDENSGMRIDASPLERRVVTFLDRLRSLLLSGRARAGHSDLVSWVARMEPSAEALVDGARSAGLYDVPRLEEAVRAVREYRARPGPLHGLARRRAYGEAVRLQTFFLVEASRRWLGWTPP